MRDRLILRYNILPVTLIIILAICYSNIKQDDAFIFYSYAKNLSQGNGYVFNLSEKLNATTSPLYTLLIAFLNFITGAGNPDKIPLIGLIVGFISLGILAYYSYRLLKISGFSKVCYILPFLILANPLLKNSVGMETYLALMLAILTIYFYLKNSFELTALFGALSVLARFDNILLMAIIISHYILRNKKLPGLKPIIIFFILLLPWFLFSYFYFGQILPTTFLIKVNQETLGFWGHGFLFLKGFATAFPGGKITFIILLIIFLISLIKIMIFDKELFRKNILILIFVWTILYIISYGIILNPPPYPWYYTFFIIPFGVIASVSLEKFFVKVSAGYLNLFIAGLFAFSLILPVITFFKPVTPKYLVYYETAKWLNENAKAGSDAAIDEIGVLGFYYKKGRVIDLLGLINPEAVTFLQKKNYQELIYFYDPEYLIVDYPERPAYEKIVTNSNFLTRYSLSTIISSEGRSVQIYQKIHH